MLCWFDRDLKLLISAEAILLNTNGLMPQVDNWLMIYYGNCGSTDYGVETAGSDKKTTDGFMVWQTVNMKSL